MVNLKAGMIAVSKMALGKTSTLRVLRIPGFRYKEFPLEKIDLKSLVKALPMDDVEVNMVVSPCYPVDGKRFRIILQFLHHHELEYFIAYVHKHTRRLVIPALWCNTPVDQYPPLLKQLCELYVECNETPSATCILYQLGKFMARGGQYTFPLTAPWADQSGKLKWLDYGDFYGLAIPIKISGSNPLVKAARLIIPYDYDAENPYVEIKCDINGPWSKLKTDNDDKRVLHRIIDNLAGHGEEVT